MFTKLRIGSVFISFVSFSFNKAHVSVPTRTCIRVIGEIRVPNKNIRFIRVVRVQKTVSATPRTNIRESAIRVQKNIRVIRYITSLRSVGLRRISCSKHLVRASKFIIGQFHIAASRNNSTFKTQHCAPRLRVQKNIRDIRFITSLRSVGLRRISCSKHLVRASKFIIGQFHIAASRNNSTFNIQNSTLRSAPPCAKIIFVLSALFVFKKIQSEIRVQKSRVPHVSALLNYK